MRVVKRFVQVFFLLLLLFDTSAWGIEWTLLSTTHDGNELSYNEKSVREVKTQVFRLWERIIFADQNVQDNVKTTLFIREINCQNNKQRIIALLDYNAKGEKLFDGANDRAVWSDSPPATPLDVLREKICRKTIKSH